MGGSIADEKYDICSAVPEQYIWEGRIGGSDMGISQKSLRAKLLIFFLLLAIVPLYILGYIAYDSGSKSIVNDKKEHLESIKLLEKIVDEYPNAKYDVQFLLYIGAYYEYISEHEEAIKAFEKVLDKYPDSPLASMAQCAIGIIYKDKLHDPEKARAAFKAVLDRYPNSLEAIWVEENT